LLRTGADARRKVAPDVTNGYAHSFTFKDLLAATGYFNKVNFIGEGGFGKVYKGKIDGQVGWRNLSPPPPPHSVL
jgi:serine/threonine-protein kinase PBS1